MIAGLLVVIVFLLIYIAGRVGRLVEALGSRDRSQPDGGAIGSDTPLTAPAEERAEPASDFQAADGVSPVEEPTAEPIVTEPETVGASGVAMETAATQEPEAQASAPAISEQPFEKDGRWWFRRDDELLVYDEQRGEWQPAPEEEPDEPWSGARSAAAESAPTSNWAATEPAQTETAEQPVTSAWDSPATSAPEPTERAAPVQSADLTHPLDEPRPGEPGYDGPDVEQPAQMSHWKCPSCGVINGSTATSCRMCFAARP